MEVLRNINILNLLSKKYPETRNRRKAPQKAPFKNPANQLQITIYLHLQLEFAS